jgi:hypothetical protein
VIELQIGHHLAAALDGGAIGDAADLPLEITMKKMGGGMPLERDVPVPDASECHRFLDAAAMHGEVAVGTPC